MRIEYIYDEKTTASIDMLERAYQEIEDCITRKIKYGFNMENGSDLTLDLGVVMHKLVKIKEVAIPVGIDLIDEEDGHIIYTERLRHDR